MRKTLIVLTAALSMAVAGHAVAQAKFSFKMTTTSPEGTVIFRVFPAEIARKIKLVTDGAVDIKPYGSGVLAGVFEGHRAVKDGRADMSFNYPAFEINQSPTSAFISDIPGGMNADTKILWVMSGGGQALWEGYRHSQGYHGVFCGALGSEVFAHAHKKIQKMADLKGYRHRTAGANTWVMRKLGAAPSLVPGPEVFTLLERKGIDGAEYLDPYGNFSFGFHKIAKYVILPGIHAPGGLYELLMKKSTWDAFPKDIQQKIELVCDSVMIRGYAELQVNNAKSIATMASSKSNEIVRLDPDVVEAVRKAGREWTELKIKEEKAKGNPWMEKLAKGYYAFQDDWKKNSTFMVSDQN